MYLDTFCHYCISLLQVIPCLVEIKFYLSIYEHDILNIDTYLYANDYSEVSTRGQRAPIMILNFLLGMVNILTKTDCERPSYVHTYIQRDLPALCLVDSLCGLRAL